MGESLVVFEYLYRDAGNFKTHGCLLLKGERKRNGSESSIRSCLEWGDQFVAEQIGVPPLCEAHWASVGEGPSDLDHAFHEFVGLRAPEPDERALEVWGALDELVRRMQAAARGWDVTLSPNCDL